MNRLTDCGYIPDRVVANMNIEQLADIYSKLCLYENSGLEPCQIDAMQGHNIALIEQIKEIELKKTYCELCPEICEESTEGCEGCPITEAFNKLYQYEDEEEKGLYLRIPCKIGDHVYTIFNGSFRAPKMILKCRISKIEITKAGIVFFARANLCEEAFVICTDYKFGISDIGDKFFLTRSEALIAFDNLKR